MKYTVSELKKYAAASEEEDGEILIPEEEIVPILPNFMKEEEEVKGATKGTAYHKVMELLDFSKIYTMDLLRENIENLKNEGYLDAGTAGCIQKKKLWSFLIRMWEKECKMQPGQKHFTASSRLFSV